MILVPLRVVLTVLLFTLAMSVMNQHLIILVKRIVRFVGLVMRVASAMAIIYLILLGNVALYVEMDILFSRKNVMTTTPKMEMVALNNVRSKMYMLASMNPQNVIYT